MTPNELLEKLGNLLPEDEDFGDSSYEDLYEIYKEAFEKADNIAREAIDLLIVDDIDNKITMYTQLQREIGTYFSSQPDDFYDRRECQWYCDDSIVRYLEEDGFYGGDFIGMETKGHLSIVTYDNECGNTPCVILCNSKRITEEEYEELDQ